MVHISIVPNRAIFGWLNKLAMGYHLEKSDFFKLKHLRCKMNSTGIKNSFFFKVHM